MTKKVLIALSILLMFFSASWAATCPTVTPLAPITLEDESFIPDRVATAQGGVVYVTDHANNRVLAFSKDGAVLAKVRVNGSVGVAVAPSGKVYISSQDAQSKLDRGKVSVYDASLNYLGDIGAGFDEFETPSDILVTSDKIYVSDSGTGLVKMFNLDGSSAGSFGGLAASPGVAGELVVPIALSVNPANGNIFVADKAKYYDSSRREWTMGVGVHEFTPAGGFVSRLPIYFSTFTVSGSVSMSSVSGVYVDSSGLVFVNDHTNGKTLVFDSSDGSFVCDTVMSDAYATPKGVTGGPDGRMFVVTDNGVMVYASANYVDMSVTPDSAALSSQECVGVNDSATITISNNGGGNLIWSATSDASWLNLTSTSGQINGLGQDTLTLSVDTASMALGSYEGTVTFVSQGDTEVVKVTYNAAGAPTLSVAEGSLALDVKGTTVSAAKALNITLAGDTSGLMRWSASVDSSWMGVSPASGGSNAQGIAQVSVKDAGLSGQAAGTYNGNITVSANCASVPAVSVPVTLTYIKGGNISVSSNIDAATFTITGPVALSGSGRDFSSDVVPAGTYTISFDRVAGYVTPRSYSMEVTENNTATFSGLYKDTREKNNVLAAAAGSRAYQVAIVDVAGSAAGGFGVNPVRTSGFSGISSVASGDVDGDGVEEVVVAHDGGIVTGLEADGTQVLGLNFNAFEVPSNVVVALADLNGDGVAEIITAPNAESGKALVRVFGYSNGAVYDTGIYMEAYRKLLGLKMATGDLNGDGADELVTTRGGAGGEGRTVEVRVFGADTSGGQGAWAASEIATFAGGFTEAGTAVAIGDFDADGIGEIVTASEPTGGAGQTEINIYNASGVKLGSFTISGSGLDVAAGDMDMDGISEIVVGDSGSNLRVYSSAGSLKAEFKAVSADDASASNITLGQVGR